jgi:hypothetical protein
MRNIETGRMRTVGEVLGIAPPKPLPRTIKTGLALTAIRNAINKYDWEDDPHDCDRECRSVYLGSIFSLTPSGKFYMPFACSNVAGCPVCNGSGYAPLTISKRVERRIRNRNSRFRRLAVKRFGMAHEWPEHVIRESDKLNRMMARVNRTCPRCAGMGSAEAHDDEVWREKAEKELDSIGLCLMNGEGDSCDLFAVEWRDKEETDAEESAGMEAT